MTTITSTTGLGSRSLALPTRLDRALLWIASRIASIALAHMRRAQPAVDHQLAAAERRATAQATGAVGMLPR